MSELERLRAENEKAKRALLAEFVQARDHAGCPTLWDAVEHACGHHVWHHDAEDVSYVQGVEAERDEAEAERDEAQGFASLFESERDAAIARARELEELRDTLHAAMARRDEVIMEWSDRAEKAEAENLAAHAVILAVKAWGQTPSNDEQAIAAARAVIWGAMGLYRVAIGDD